MHPPLHISRCDCTRCTFGGTTPVIIALGTVIIAKILRQKIQKNIKTFRVTEILPSGQSLQQIDRCLYCQMNSKIRNKLLYEKCYLEFGFYSIWFINYCKSIHKADWKHFSRISNDLHKLPKILLNLQVYLILSVTLFSFYIKRVHLR